jgi:phage repressor protein C with HTH and peptisase S24 domain
MRLAAGSGGTIDITDDIGTSTIVIHAPSIGRTSSRNLQAFRVGGDSMEPEIAQGGIVLADISENNLGRLKEGKIYVLCWEIYEGECAVKYLSWAERDRSVLITSPDNRLHRPIIKHVNEIQLIGRVIWSWREHD